MTIDVSQYREDLEYSAPFYNPSFVAPEPGEGRRVPPAMLIALLLAASLNQADRIERRCRRIERKVNHILCHLCPHDFDLDDLNSESDDEND